MSRRRRKHAEEHTNHERWLVSYADFITLLFAFFVVMYAISSVNEGKYRVLSNTLTEAFEQPVRSHNPIQLGGGSGLLPGGERLAAADSGPGREEGGILPEVPPAGGTQEALRAGQKRLGYIADTIESVLGPYVDDGQVSVSHHGSWVEVTLKSTLLFPSGSAELSDRAVRILRDVSRILKPLPNSVHVEGYTDNVPINTAAFPSNWELSAARAASVVHLFSRFGVDPRRMAAVGFGEFRPIVSNATEEGRRSNRRVALIIGAKDAATPGRGGGP